jgi:AcrR family transcriptional regulator
MLQKRSTLMRRKQIVNAVGKLIIKYGSERVTVRRIAKEIGTSESAIYRHFRSKKDILSFLIDDIESSLLSEIELGTDHSCTLQTLESLFMNHMSRIVQTRGVSFQVIAEIVSLGDKKLNKKVYEAISRYTNRVRDILAEGVKAGVVRQDVDLDAMSTLFFGMTQGLVNIWTLSQYQFNLEQKYASLWAIFREAATGR